MKKSFVIYGLCGLFLTTVILFHTKSNVIAQVVCNLAIGDLDCSGRVNAVDLSVLLRNFGQSSTGATATPQPTARPTTRPTSAATPTVTVRPTTPPTGCVYPSQLTHVASWTRWKINLPDGREVKQLANFKAEPWFMVAENCTGVQFRAHTDTNAGGTTQNSTYLRSELRERTNDGSADIFWSSTNGTHTMIIDQKVTRLPYVHPHMVVGQIHGKLNGGPQDDATVVRLEGAECPSGNCGNPSTIDIWATKDDAAHGTKAPFTYTLGTRFQVKLVATPGKLETFWKGPSHSDFVPIQTWTGQTVTDAYFKAGAYVQSNCESDREGSACSINNYGEVIIYNVTVTHQ